MKTVNLCLGLFFAGLCAYSAVSHAAQAATPGDPQQGQSLVTLIKRALIMSPEIISADLQASAAHRTAAVARANRAVQVTANSYFATGSSGAILSAASMAPFAGSMTVQSGTVVDQNLTVMVPVFTGGRLEALEHAATRGAAASDADAEEVKLDVTLRVVEAYYRVLMARADKTAADNQAAMAAELKRNAQAMYETGKGLQSSVMRADSEIEEANRLKAIAASLETHALLDLKLQAGLPPGEAIEVRDNQQMPQTREGLDLLIQFALQNRPDAKAAALRIQSAREQRKATSAERGVQIYGTLMADALAAAQPSGHGGYTVGLMATVPLFDGGNRRAMLDQAMLSVQRAEQEERRIKLQIETQVRSAWADRETAAVSLHASQARKAALDEVRSITSLRLQNQKALMVEALDANAASAAAAAQEIRSEYDYFLADAALKRAAGTLLAKEVR